MDSHVISEYRLLCDKHKLPSLPSVIVVLGYNLCRHTCNANCYNLKLVSDTNLGDI